MVDLMNQSDFFFPVEVCKSNKKNDLQTSRIDRCVERKRESEGPMKNNVNSSFSQSSMMTVSQQIGQRSCYHDEVQ